MSPEKSNRKKKPVHTDVPKEVQETVLYWYRGQKMVKVHSTNNSDIKLLQRRGWEPMTGPEAEVALPYLIYVLPRRSITFRSKPKRKHK